MTKKKKKKGVLSEPISSVHMPTVPIDEQSSKINNSVPKTSNNAVSASPQTNVDYGGDSFRRSELSHVKFALDMDLPAIDPLTGRKHCPLINEVIKLNPTGATGSILNRVCQTSLQKLLCSPEWYSTRLSVGMNFDFKLFEVYFNMIADVICVRNICLNLLSLYDDWQSNSVYSHDKVMRSLLNDFFSDFVPRRKVFTSSIERLEDHLEFCFLPKYFINEIDDAFKFVSLPYHGFEILLTKSCLIHLPSNIFDSDYQFDPSATLNLSLNFPFDESIVGNKRLVFQRFVRIINFFDDKLVSLDKSFGEFSEVHSLFRDLVPEWKVSLTDSDSYCYTRLLRDDDRFSLLNPSYMQFGSPSVSKPLSYIHYKQGSIKASFSEIYDSVYYNVVNFPYHLTSVGVQADDSFANNLWVIKRTYSRHDYWHDSSGGFNLQSGDLMRMAFPFMVLPSSNCKSLPNYIIEPGMIYRQNDFAGISGQFSFVDSAVSNIKSISNLVGSLSISDIIDYNAAISRRSGFYYYFKNLNSALTKTYISNNISNVQGELYFISHPSLRRVGIDFSCLCDEYEEICRGAWTSATLQTHYLNRTASNARSEYKIYSVNIVS